jgi:hypothetical protein
MTVQRIAIVLLALGWAASAAADDSGNFIYRLGQDTTSVEHYTRTGSKVELDQVGRAPRTLRRHYVFDYKNGVLAHASLVATPPGSDTPTQTVEANFDADSVHMEVKSPTGSPQHVVSAVPKGAVVIAGGSPWPFYEASIMKLAAAKPDSLRAPLYLLGATSPNNVVFRKLGKDSIDITTDRLDHFRVKIDKTGHVQAVRPLAGTAKFAATRVEKLDVDAYAKSFMGREQSGGGMGALSPRDSVKVTAGGASLYVDYGRPAKRGRVVFGGVVPYGEVWRTGANAATQFRTDKALDFGGTVVPAGFYTLWTVPSADGWKLIVNSETGQWGTEHKADKDLYTIPMKTSTLPQSVERFTITVEPSAQGGTIDMDWDTTRASATFVAK